MRFLDKFEISESARFFETPWIPRLFVHEGVYLSKDRYGDEHGIYWLGLKPSQYKNVMSYKEHISKDKENNNVRGKRTEEI